VVTEVTVLLKTAAEQRLNLRKLTGAWCGLSTRAFSLYSFQILADLTLKQL